MRAFISQQSTQSIGLAEEPNSNPRTRAAQPDPGWSLRNKVASAILLAVIGVRLIGPAQPSHQEAATGAQAVQTADWLDDIINGILGGGKP